MINIYDRIQNRIDSIWDELDLELEKLNNSLLLFDFTTVFYKGENYGKVQSTYKYAIDRYPELLSKYFNEYGYSVKVESEGDSELKPDVFSIEDELSNLSVITPISSRFDPEKDEAMEIVRLDTWYKFIVDNEFAAASWILFKDFFNDVDSNERIEVGVYILLKNPVKGWITGCDKQSKEHSEKIKWITGCDKQSKEHSEKINKLLSDSAYRFLFNSGLGYIADEFKKRKAEIQSLTFEKEQLNIKRDQQRSINHYLRPAFVGISNQARDIRQYSNTDKVKSIAKTLELQTSILEFNFKLGSDLEKYREEESTSQESIIIKFDTFFKYIYIFNFFTGNYIDNNSIEKLTDDEFNKIQKLCTSRIDKYYNEKKNDEFKNIVDQLYDSLSQQSSFKILFYNTEGLYFYLTNDITSMDLVIKFSSVFIENYKKHWIVDSKLLNDRGQPFSYDLMIYYEDSKLYFFQNKDMEGFKDNIVNKDNFKDYISEFEKFEVPKEKKCLGISDLSTLLKGHHIQHEMYKRQFDYKIKIKDELSGIDEKVNKNVELFFQLLTVNEASKLIQNNHEKI